MPPPDTPQMAEQPSRATSGRPLMLLRRVMKHVRDQNWFAVGLDFLIVVVGVFIGIQVANWNESRAEDELAKRYVAQLMGDIEADINDIEVGYNTSEWRLAALTALLAKSGVPLMDTTYLPERAFEIPRSPIDDHSVTYLMNASTYTRFLDNDRPVYVSLVGSGNARLIGKLKPWPCIQSYYAQYDEVKLFEERLLLFRTELVRTLHDGGLSIAGNLPEKETLERIRDDEKLAAALSRDRYDPAVRHETRPRPELVRGRAGFRYRGRRRVPRNPGRQLERGASAECRARRSARESCARGQDHGRIPGGPTGLPSDNAAGAGTAARLARRRGAERERKSVDLLRNRTGHPAAEPVAI